MPDLNKLQILTEKAKDHIRESNWPKSAKYTEYWPVVNGKYIYKGEKLENMDEMSNPVRENSVRNGSCFSDRCGCACRC